MSYSFQILSPTLHQVALIAAKYFRDTHGITKFDVETEIFPGVRFCPTLHAATRDHHLICVEVNDNAYPVTIDAVLVDCISKGLPVRLFVAVPKNDKDHGFQDNLRLAKEHGVGVIIIDANGCSEMAGALSLSLVGLRTVDAKRFPVKYRESISSAVSTFKNGDPSNGCATIYEQVEALTRRIAKKIHSKGFWKPTHQTHGIDLDNGAWAKVCDQLLDGINHKSLNCTKLNRELLSRIRGLTGRRNQSAHVPKNLKTLIKRDRELRTRFEEALDTLDDLIEASKPLKV